MHIRTCKHTQLLFKTQKTHKVIGKGDSQGNWKHSKSSLNCIDAGIIKQKISKVNHERGTQGAQKGKGHKVPLDMKMERRLGRERKVQKGEGA